jgi:hypothetical protein
VDLVAPADVVVAGRPGGARRPLSDLDVQAHADGVVGATGEAVVIGERIATAVLGHD